MKEQRPSEALTKQIFVAPSIFFASKTFNQEMFDWKLMISWVERNMVFGGKCGLMKKFDRDGSSCWWAAVVAQW